MLEIYQYNIKYETKSKFLQHRHMQKLTTIVSVEKTATYATVILRHSCLSIFVWGRVTFFQQEIFVELLFLMRLICKVFISQYEMCSPSVKASSVCIKICN